MHWCDTRRTIEANDANSDSGGDDDNDDDDGYFDDVDCNDDDEEEDGVWGYFDGGIEAVDGLIETTTKPQ